MNGSSEVPVYCISGLGADFRIFRQLRLSKAALHPVKWEIPTAEDSLGTYAARLASQIPDHAVLLGVSFGGMLATEIAKLKPLSLTIIISSSKRRSELPGFLRIAGRLGLHKRIPYLHLTRSKILSRLVFDPRSKAEELYLKQIMIQHADPTFLKRAVNMILTWQQDEPPTNIIHIHGTKDHLLTPGPVQADYWIKGGGHFMIWNKADEISEIINQQLTSLKHS